MRVALLDVHAVANAINVPLEHWPGQCYGIAAALLKTGLIPDGTLRYGHWRGPIHRRSRFASRRALGFVQHGWIERSFGIVDPTRFVFEAAEPFIYQGPNDQYDAGGNVWRRACESPPPPVPGAADRLAPLHVGGETAAWVTAATSTDPACLSWEQVFWLANLSLSTLGVHAGPLVAALITAGHGALIPLDNRRLVAERMQAHARE